MKLWLLSTAQVLSLIWHHMYPRTFSIDGLSAFHVQPDVPQLDVPTARGKLTRKLSSVLERIVVLRPRTDRNQETVVKSVYKCFWKTVQGTLSLRLLPNQTVPVPSNASHNTFLSLTPWPAPHDLHQDTSKSLPSLMFWRSTSCTTSISLFLTSRAGCRCRVPNHRLVVIETLQMCVSSSLLPHITYIRESVFHSTLLHRIHAHLFCKPCVLLFRECHIFWRPFFIWVEQYRLSASRAVPNDG